MHREWKSENNSEKNPKNNKDDYQITFRGTTDLPDLVSKALNTPNPDGVILDKGFMSTSGDIKTAKSFTGYSYKSQQSALFIIKSKSCIGISALSAIESEDEFLCPPGLKFNVKKTEENPNTYILEEI